MKWTGGRLLRWAAIAFACAAGFAIVGAITVYRTGQFRSFYLPSEGMAPTLEKQDRFVALMDGARTLKRGQVIVFAVGENIYVKRVAALAGDTIGMRDGIVLLNGSPVAQRFLRAERRAEGDPGARARRLAERFPGEAAAHEILDMGPSDYDDVPELRVPAGFMFVLGDHRDRSADSRVPRHLMGVEMLAVDDVLGHALFYTWPLGKMGRKVAQ